MKSITEIEIILYVNDQVKSTDFYTALLRKKPRLCVSGMTEFVLSECCILGLMPNNGIAKIFKDEMPHPEMGNGIPRCELYLRSQDLDYEFDNAVKIGAKLISPIENRNWGDNVCYFSDLDGHIIAFASKIR